MSTEKALSKNEQIAALTKSPHGKLEEYVPVGKAAALADGDFFAHLVAWNHVRGQIRDAKVALPVIALAHSARSEYVENALAHIADLRPREFARAVAFFKPAGARVRVAHNLTERYLRDLEADERDFDRTSVLHASTLKGLYARYGIKPSALAQKIVFEGSGGKRAILRGLRNLTPEQIAGAIMKFRLPFLAVRGALEKRALEPDVLTALVGAMTPTELVTNMKALTKMGVNNVPSARAALEEAITKAGSSKKATLKTSKAAESVGDEGIARKLHSLQEKQLDVVKGIEGDWLVLGDKSGSMAACIDKAKEVASGLARLVRGKVHLVFFDSSPRYYDVSGKTLEEIKAMTRGITAGGMTSIGCGWQYLLEKGVAVDGIAIVSDGGDNSSPQFHQVFEKFEAKMGHTPTVYFYKLGSGSPLMANMAKHDMQVFDVAGVDYYSLPNLVQTMRVGRYNLLDEVLGVDLKTLDMVLDRTKGYRVGKQLVGA